MRDDRRARMLLRVLGAAFVLALLASAVVPGDAWAPGSRQLAHADVVTSTRVLHAPTGLTVTPTAGGVVVSTGDGGGAGAIVGLGAPVRARAAAFRGDPCWEIGSDTDAPATYVDDNGVRLDDGMIDRLRVRAWPWALSLALAALAARATGARWDGRVARWAAPLMALATIVLAWRLIG